MPKSSNIFLQEFRSRPIAYGVQVVGIVIILLNVWLSTKLFPLAKNIDEVIARVNAMEVDIVELREDERLDAEIVVKMEAMRIMIDEINKRVERIDTRLAKHMGI